MTTDSQRSIDMNCDLGENFGVYRHGQDEAVMPFISSANIACGYHAGDPRTMRETVRLCLEQGVAIGAHPGLPDLNGFGRREIGISAQEAYDYVVYQTGALDAFVRSEGGVLRHIKPHGALYNMAARDPALAEAIAEAVYRLNPSLILFGLSGSQLIAAGKRLGLATASEVFADRAYRADGSLVPRTEANALINDEEQAARRVLQMVRQGSVTSSDGAVVPIEADTVCLHGDGARAPEFAKLLRSVLDAEGIAVTAPGSK